MENQPSAVDLSDSLTATNQPVPVRLRSDGSGAGVFEHAGGLVPAAQPPLSRLPRHLKLAALVGAVVLLIGGGGLAWYARTRLPQAASQVASSLNSQLVPLNEIGGAAALAEGSRTLNVNGQLNVNGALVFVPGTQPVQPVDGQLYYDKTTSRLKLSTSVGVLQLQTNLDGQGGSTTNNISNITNQTIVNGGGGVPAGIALLGDSQTFTGTNTFKPANNATNSFKVQNASGNNLLAVDTTTGVIAVTSPDSTGSSGSVTIQTGNSSTTAAGNVVIDAGSSVINGTVVGTKMFESGLDGMWAWFNTTVATTSAEAHTGSSSLEYTMSNAFWGIGANQNVTGIPVIPGHQYYVSLWVKSGSLPRTINATLVWEGSPVLTPLNAVIDNASTWTEMTVTTTAPAGAIELYFTLTGVAAAGETHYLDDMVVTDLSSSSAFSTIEIGKTNAKSITLGNMNQIGPTSIFGGSGIRLASGAADIVMTGGAMSFTGAATSTLKTTSGALVLTSANATTWGVAPAASGNGENLTLYAGGGSGGNDNGGNVVIQGGLATGSGAGGGVVVKPQTDTALAFQIQDSAGTAFLRADSAGREIAVSGSDSAYAGLTLADAHIRSTQTTPPTIGVPSACGTTPSAAVTSGSTDAAGSFTVTAGSGAVAGPCAVVLTFHQAYATAPKAVIITPTTAVGVAPQGKNALVSATTTADITVTIAPTNPAADEVNSYYYWVIE